jgi:hypothetical protein
MTLKIPPISFADKFLKILGKNRGLIIDQNSSQLSSISGYNIAIKESFWKALFRQKGQSVPSKMANYYDLDQINKA